MKLSISNIIWEKGKNKFEYFIKEIKKNDVHNIELSLNSIFEEPSKMSKQNLRWLKTLLQSYDISISALHSLTYTRPDLELFNTVSQREALIDYMKFYFDIAQELHTNNLVYGSPKTRYLHNFNKTEADNIFLDFLYRIDELSLGINFNIEPLPKSYCEYLNTFLNAVKLLEMNKYENIFIQLDVRSIIESEEKINEIFIYNTYIKHVHIGEPKLTMSADKYNEVHSLVYKKLADMRYSGYLGIEVLNQEGYDFEKYLESTIKKVRTFYGG